MAHKLQFWQQKARRSVPLVLFALVAVPMAAQANSPAPAAAASPAADAKTAADATLSPSPALSPASVKAASPSQSAAGAAAVTSASAPAPPRVASLPSVDRGPALRLHWAQVRANAQVVQNNVGNAYSLQAGWAPHLRLRALPLGLRLLAEFGVLRSQDAQLFVAPSAQALFTWQVVPHLELGLGAGVQWWCVPEQVVRPVATAEAHYTPHHRVAKLIRSAFVAASLGASGGAGLQVRAGLSFDFLRDADYTHPAPAPAVASHLTALPLADDGEAMCPPCPACVVAQDKDKEEAPPQNVLLAKELLFAFNSARISPAALAYLHELGAALAAEPEAWTQLEVVGHADSIGTAPHTLLVSMRRADAVRAALEEAGVDGSRLVARGVGETQPIVGERPEHARQRRVTLRLGGLHGSPRLHNFVHLAPTAHPETRP